MSEHHIACNNRYMFYQTWDLFIEEDYVSNFDFVTPMLRWTKRLCRKVTILQQYIQLNRLAFLQLLLSCKSMICCKVVDKGHLIHYHFYGGILLSFSFSFKQSIILQSNFMKYIQEYISVSNPKTSTYKKKIFSWQSHEECFPVKQSLQNPSSRPIQAITRVDKGSEVGLQPSSS